MNIKLKEEIRFSMRLRGAGGRGKLTCGGYIASRDAGRYI